jgi:hypothetical protein
MNADEAIERALLYVFQLSDKDYRKFQTALSESAFVRALEQDGFTVAAIRAETPAHCPWCGGQYSDMDGHMAHAHGVESLRETPATRTDALDVESDGDDRHVIDHGRVVVYGTRDEADICANALWVARLATPPEAQAEYPGRATLAAMHTPERCCSFHFLATAPTPLPERAP